MLYLRSITSGMKLEILSTDASPSRNTVLMSVLSSKFEQIGATILATTATFIVGENSTTPIDLEAGMESGTSCTYMNIM